MNHEYNLKDKTAVVTGANGYLGQHFCKTLQSQGAHVFALDVQEDVLNFAKSQTTPQAPKMTGLICDVSSESSIQDAVNTIKKTNDIHVLINNAAWKTNDVSSFLKPSLEYDQKTFEEVLRVNVLGMFNTAKAVASHMIDKKTGGSIIQIGSIYGLLAPDQRIYQETEIAGSPVAYTVSKAAVLGLTKHFATEWAHHKIRVNTLVPGGVNNNHSDIFKKHYTNRIPLKRMAEPEDLLGAVLFLASDLSSYVTGQSLIVDGGLSAW